MADLGTITSIYLPPQDPNQPTVLVSNYQIHRGRPLGAIAVNPNPKHQPTLHQPVANYLVRQLRVLFRQLWPTHGQRFPQ